MAIQLSVAARNGRLNAIETELGGTAVLKMFSGAQPANCAAANSGTELWTETLPADVFDPAGSGQMVKATGTWSAVGIGGGGVIAHFRLYKSNGTTCVMQGSVGIGTGDLQLDNTTIADGQVATVTAFTLNDANA